MNIREEKNGRTLVRRLGLVSLLAGLAMAGSAKAVVIDLTGLNNAGGTSTSGTLSVTTGISDNSATTGTVSYLISGLDIEGDLTADDSISFQVGLSSNGGNLRSGLSLSANDFGIAGNGAALINVNEELSYSLGTATVTLGSGSLTPTSLVVAFTGARISSGTGQSIGGGTSNDGFIAGNQTFDPIAAFSTGAPNQFYSSFDARITADVIPEPSVSILAGVSAVALLARRRRRVAG